jgi:tetratricopeptide (TPR) repeat protein
MLSKLDSIGYAGSVILLVILLWTGIVFSNSINNDFIASWDDKIYILENPYIKDFSLQGIKSIFNSFHAANYHPLTTLSWAVEYRLFGINPRVNHITNLAFHLLNTILVFCLIILLTRKVAVSAIVALFFAIHPLHVEAVSFISQRKDVLYTFFYLASLISYVHYVKDGKKTGLIGLSLVFFLLSLLSKSMAVTLPVILLLLDYYLGRPFSRRNILEKTPFFLLSLVFGIVAILSQRAFGAITDLPSFSLFERLFLVTHSFLFYIVKLFAPVNLSAMYCYPTRSAGGTLPLQYYLAPVVILFLALVVLKSHRLRKDLVFGIGFFLVTISPVLQAIPVGAAIVAERYSYVPYVGLFFIISQFSFRILAETRQNVKALQLIVVIILVAYAMSCSIATWRRNKVWKNSFTLWSDVIKKNPSVTVAYYNRGVVRFNTKDYQGAISDYSKAIQLKPDYATAYNNRGEAKTHLQDFDGALNDLDMAIALNPDYSHAYYERGNVKHRLKDYRGAADDFSKTIALKPDHVNAYLKRANSRSRLRDYKGAINDLNKVIQLRPDGATAYNNRGIAKAVLGDYKTAINDFNMAIQLEPDYQEAYDNRQRAESRLDRHE